MIPPEVVKQLQLDMRKKGKRPQDIQPYIVPLSLQAIEIVQYLLERVKPAQHYLLTHRSDLTKRISENTHNGALQRLGCKELLQSEERSVGKECVRTCSSRGSPNH